MNKEFKIRHKYINLNGTETINDYTINQLSEKTKTSEEIRITNKENKSYSFIYDSTELKNEKFKEYPNCKDKIFVSNLGRVKTNNIVITQEELDDKKEGYLVLKGCYRKLGYVYRLVAETWCKKDENQKENLGYWTVHHISNNGYDNCPGNLVWIRCDLHKKIRHKT